MGSSVSPIVANIYMETFEDRAINTALHPPRMWRRYVDDTFVVQQKSHKEAFFQHINTVNTSIKFTMEEARPDGSIPFLDILVTPKVDGTFTTRVYRKPTHTDQYLQWDSNHNVASMYSVINTLHIEPGLNVLHQNLLIINWNIEKKSLGVTNILGGQ